MHNARGQIDDRVGNNNLIGPRGARNGNRRRLWIEALPDCLGDQRGERSRRHGRRSRHRRQGSIARARHDDLLHFPKLTLQARCLEAYFARYVMQHCFVRRLLAPRQLDGAIGVLGDGGLA